MNDRDPLSFLELVVLALSMMIGLAACESCGDDAPLPPRHECTRDRDCGTPRFICQAYVCVEGCRSDLECAESGGYCDLTDNRCVTCLENAHCRTDYGTGFCEDDFTCSECNSDDHCLSGSRGFCNPASHMCVECLNDDQCRANEVCELSTSTCREGCRDSTDCAIGERCDVARTCVPGCDEAFRCPMGQYCELATNTCLEGCESDAECSTERICESHACVLGCRSELGSANCLADQTCACPATDPACEIGVCFSGEWKVASSNTGFTPPARSHCMMEYEPVAKVVVMFGGLMLHTDPERREAFDDLWVRWRGGWHPVDVDFESTGWPSKRGWAGMTYSYDPEMQGIVLRGGARVISSTGQIQGLDDAWLLRLRFEHRWRGTWSRIPAGSSPGRIMATDLQVHPNVQHTNTSSPIYFGGVQNVLFSGLDATRAYVRSDWISISSPFKPEPRYAHSMVMITEPDPLLLMFGGAAEDGELILEDDQLTWAFDGMFWQRRNSGTQPPGRQDFVLQLDSRRGVVVLFGGGSLLTETMRPTLLKSDTWEYDPTTGAWRSVITRAGALERMGMCSTYDPELGRIVMFGGATPDARYTDTTMHYGGD